MRKQLVVPILVLIFAITYATAHVPPDTIVPGYTVSNLTQQSWGYSGTLNLIPGSVGPFGDDIQTLSLMIYFQTDSIVRIKIIDPNNERWEVPTEYTIEQQSPPSKTPTNLQYSVEVSENPFSISIVRVSNGMVVFNSTSPTEKVNATQFSGLIYENQYLQWSTQMDNNANIYGLGERVDTFRLDTNKRNYEMFNRDQGAALQDRNLYGTHPFYLEVVQTASEAQAHGVFLFNSNAMSFYAQPGAMTFQTIGGVFDFWIMVGPTPHDVIQQYSSIVGKPKMPPYWHLGFNQCRWGYHTIQETASVAINYKRFNIPLDTMWNDIDYMDQYKDFTTDPVNFPGEDVQEFIDYLHSQGQHYMIIVDPGIKIEPGYSAFDIGMEENIFIMEYNDDIPEVGKVWPGYTNFPDFTSSAARQYWSNLISTFHKQDSFDGLWIDMNEISNFCVGSCLKQNMSQYSPENDPFDNPPFNPLSQPLNISTISMNAMTSLGVNYNTHNLYGFYESIATHNALENIFDKRSVVLSRSTYVGSGRYTSHWLGDNFSTWDYLYNSIAGVLSMQLFAIPMVGVDICGFNGNTTEELCSRWMQLGSFYPFSRNHNSISSIAQEPWAFQSEQHIEICRTSLNIRYSFLPYYYTLFYSAHVYGLPVWNALVFLYPNDPNVVSIDRQFMVGNAILVSPVLDKGATSVEAYFPNDVWYDYYTGDQVQVATNGSWINLSAPITKIPVHLRGGTIIPSQMPALTTTESRKNPFVLLVQLNNTDQATGYLYLDDGESLSTFTESTYTLINFSVNNGELVAVTEQSGYEDASSLFVSEIKVYGQMNPVTTVTVNGKQTEYNFKYSTQHKVLLISGLVLPLSEYFTVTWS